MHEIVMQQFKNAVERDPVYFNAEHIDNNQN